MPDPGFRKLTITLTIVVIVAQSSCGFTLHRKKTAEAIPGPTTDLVSLESLQVQSIKRPNDIRQGKNDDTSKATKNKHKFNSEQKVFLTEATLKESEKTFDTIPEEITTTRTEPAVTDRNYESETTTEEIKTRVRENTTIPSTALLQTSKRESIENITEDETHATNYSVDFTTAKIQPETEEPKTATETKADYQESSTKTQNIRYSKEGNEDEVKSTLTDPNINDQIAIDSEASENLSSSNEPVTIETTVNIVETENTETETEASLHTSTKLSSSSQIDEESKSSTSEATIGSLSKSSSFNKLKFESSELPEEALKSSSTIVEVKVTKDSSITTTEPNWKKYVTIERKRSGSSEESTSTEKDLDSAKAESIQTTLPVPFSEILREDLLSNANRPTTAIESQAGTATVEIESTPSSKFVESTQSNSPGTLASKRAGFLDLSKRTSTHYQETSNDQNLSYRDITEMETSDIDSFDIKKLNGFKSQGQLAQDAMREEELLKEEITSNHEENAKRYVEGKSFSDNVKPALTTSQAIVEDNLSVQPISQDRRTTLYTVGPNYKPMKRIEVQPAKPFVRDPDDNSWRNESISSLGIVFKPKNSSSKSFKEVLKTKTETEFNNAQDKDSKDDTPELRERLEKIAEVRKSKKKRIDKNGDVVYTDYEEGSSAEGTNTPKVETTSTEINTSETPSTLSTKIPETEVTLPNLTTKSERYWKNKLETISKEEMFKDIGLDILTTQKTKKPYNLAEYYDTTDEYDADYVTLPKIDLKKFTIPFKPSFPSPKSPPVTLVDKSYSMATPPTTVVVPSRFKDRQPTVQYFPPTTKTPGERRVKLYTLKETPKTNPPFEASEPVATERPQMRSTVKPSDFTMFTPPQPPDSLTKHMFVTNVPRVTDAFVLNDGNFNRGTYVIKHYKDFLTDAAKEEEDVGSPDFIPFTETPGRGVTLDELAQATTKIKPDDFEYDSQFRKDVLSRFVDNFNQNSDRYKVDFPVLFNTSVVHRSNDEQGRVLASSSTFMRRLYGNEMTATRPPGPASRGCEPNCDNITLELSPAYELHYYVPEQEEKEEASQQAATLPYRYKL